jgi:hypothetical protein
MMGEKSSLAFLQENRKVCCKKQCAECFTRNHRNDIAWMKVGICKLSGLRRGRDKGSCYLCSRKGHAKLILLRGPKTQMWRREFIGKKCLTGMRNWCVEM